MKKYRVSSFGVTKKGEAAKLITLQNEAGMAVSISDYGASLVNIIVPDKDNNPVEVILGYDDASDYERGTCSIGAVVGRNANRIAGAAFVLNGETYTLDANEGKNNLHSGNDYYYKRLWQTPEISDDRVTFLLHSPDGDQGYPGAADVAVTYSLDEENGLTIHYEAVPDADTILNLTNHAYFNLNGHKSGSALGHFLTMDADEFTPADAESIPYGTLESVDDTPMDFRLGRTFDEDIGADFEQLHFGRGYDHNFALNNCGEYHKVAELEGDKSGIVMEVWTDLPGMQLYTGNFLDNEPGRGGAVYAYRSAVCLETQYFPDAIHHETFESPVTKAGEKYETKTMYKFTILSL